MIRAVFLACAFPFLCSAGLTNVDQEPMNARVWQTAKGEYCVQIMEENGHLFIMHMKGHSEECPCKIKELSKPFESTR